MVCWSIFAQTPHLLTTGCFRGDNENLTGPHDPPPGWGYLLEPFLDFKGHVCYDWTVKWAFLAPLLMLQVIMVLWFLMIVRVAVKVIRGDGADDVRSDGEEEEEEEGLDGEEEEEEEVAEPLEEEVGVEELDLKNWERRTGVKRQAGSTGVNIPGHSDRKELLGRIGCEKQVE
jgi:very-long-chain ceramide synthase